MNKFRKRKLTLKSLADEIRWLRERIEDLEDLMELRSAFGRNAGKPGTPWEQVKKELETDYEDLPDVLAALEKPGTPIPMTEIRKKYGL